MSQPTTSARLRESVAEEIRVLLARRRLSAAKLAQQLGWSQPYMARRMVGAQTFDLDDLEQIARALEVTIYDLLPAPDNDDDRTPGQRKRRPIALAETAAWVPPRPREPVVSGTVAHPGHPVLAGAARLPGPNGVRRTAPTGL